TTLKCFVVFRAGSRARRMNGFGSTGIWTTMWTSAAVEPAKSLCATNINRAIYATCTEIRNERRSHPFVRTGAAWRSVAVARSPIAARTKIRRVARASYAGRELLGARPPRAGRPVEREFAGIRRSRNHEQPDDPAAPPKGLRAAAPRAVSPSGFEHQN